MSESRPFVHLTDRDGPVGDRASTMVRFVLDKLEFAGTGPVNPTSLALTSIRLKLLGHPNPNICVDMQRVGRSWRSQADGQVCGFEEAWEHYLELLAERGEGKRTELRLSGIKEICLDGEYTRLEAGARHRIERTYGRSRETSWADLALKRTFGPSGAPGFCVRQRHFSESWRGLPQGTYSDYTFWHASRNRRLGLKLRDAPDEWATELDEQFGNRIPIKAFTPDEWRVVLETAFTNDDVMTEKR